MNREELTPINELDIVDNGRWENLKNLGRAIIEQAIFEFNYRIESIFNYELKKQIAKKNKQAFNVTAHEKIRIETYYIELDQYYYTLTNKWMLETYSAQEVNVKAFREKLNNALIKKYGMKFIKRVLLRFSWWEEFEHGN